MARAAFLFVVLMFLFSVTQSKTAYAGGETCGVVVGFDPATAETEGFLVLENNGSRESLTIPSGVLLPPLNVGDAVCVSVGQFDGVGLRKVIGVETQWLESAISYSNRAEGLDQITIQARNEAILTIFLVWVCIALTVGGLSWLFINRILPKKSSSIRPR